MLRTYTDLARLHTYEERFRYLVLSGAVGEPTFGSDRWLNQRFYRSVEWNQVRNFVIARDNGCDLGIEGYDIHAHLLIHHMNPMSAEDIKHGNEDILEPEFLITTTHTTHNAIHYGDVNQLPRQFTERQPGDTLLWGKGRHR